MSANGVTIGAGVRFAGWPLTGWAALAVGGMCASILVAAGTGEEGFRLLTRATARTSLFFFLAAFTASALARARPGAATRWLLDNRRYLGVSFGISHAYHAFGIGMLALTSEEFRRNAVPLTVAFGAFAYVVLAAMVATSFDRSAAWLGARRWRQLHGFGVYYLWFIFTFTLLPGTFHSPLHFLMTAALVGSLALRIATRRRAA